MNILVIGEYYSSNLGDGVICQNVVRLIKEKYPKCNIDIVDISNQIDFLDNRKKNNSQSNIKKLFNYYFHYRFCKKTEFRKFKYEFLNKKYFVKQTCKNSYDLAIFAGGQLFMDYFTFPIYYYVKYLTKNKTPIIFNACGMGPNNDKKLIKMMKKALNNKGVKAISTRDDLDKLAEVYFDGNKNMIRATYDSAICTSDTFKLNSIQSNKIGLGVISCKTIKKEDGFKIWKEIIQELERKKLSWEIFCNGCPGDYAVANELLSYLGYSEEEKQKLIAPRPKRPQELVDTIARYKKIIAFRLHSHIIAYSLNIPSVALIWDDKLKFFFDKINHSERCFNAFSSADKVVETLLLSEYTKEDMQLRDEQKKYLKKILYCNLEKKVKEESKKQ